MAKVLRVCNSVGLYGSLDVANRFEISLVISDRRDCGMGRRLSLDGMSTGIQKRNQYLLTMVGMEESKISLKHHIGFGCSIALPLKSRIGMDIFSDGGLGL